MPKPNKGTDGESKLAVEVMKMCADVKAYITGTQDDDRKFSIREILEMFRETMHTQSLDQSMSDYLRKGEITEDDLMFNSPDAEAVIHRQTKLDIKLGTKWDPTGALIQKALDQQLVMQQTKEDSEEEANAS
ncbi:MAG: hypothetical protein ABIA04_03925 [Pseudomonadota bacterium]